MDRPKGGGNKLKGNDIFLRLLLKGNKGNRHGKNAKNLRNYVDHRQLLKISLALRRGKCIQNP